MIAEVIINSNVKNLNKIFDYTIPVELESRVNIGTRVFVPFGNMKKLEEGFVIGIKEKSEYKLKSIDSIEEKGCLSEEKMELAKIMAHRYFCNVSDCVKLMLPPGTTTRNFENRISDKLQNFVYLKKDEEEIEKDIENKKIKSDKQIRALQFLKENDGTIATDLQAFADVSNAVIKTLEKNEYIEIISKEVERNPFIHKVVEKSTDLKLTQEQQEAYEKIAACMDFDEYDEFLLFGVTGSGKTEV